MVEVYPQGPAPAGKDIKPGEGINICPFDQHARWDFTGPPGYCSKVYLGISLQLPKWGYVRYKIDEWIFVSHMDRRRYELMIGERENLQNKIKAHLASIATAISDLELAKHDLRKYREFMSYFAKIERGKRLVKEKRKEEGERLIREGDQTLRAIFIDQVDVHTGEGISLRSIAVRWPTIIADFMKLSDVDRDPKEIARKLKVSEAEGVVLATKNKLYLEWKKMFERNVRERYETLVRLVEARRNSVIEYRNMVKPLIARYKMITDALEKSEARLAIYKSFFRPDAQAFTLDGMKLWAWRAFAPVEKYKIYRETPLDEIPATKAGFTLKEVQELEKVLEGWKGKVPALPIPRAYDEILRGIVKNLEKKYGVPITPKDVYDAIQELANQYTAGLEGKTEGETWPFSPYFVFIELNMDRLVYRFPDGTEFEDLDINPVRTYAKTQNIILGHILEIKARGKVLEREIDKLLGEVAFKEDKGRWVRIETLLKEEFPDIYGEIKVEEKEEPKKKRGNFLEKINKVFEFFGWKLSFLRAKGPYEFAFFDRLTKYYFTFTGTEMAKVKEYFTKAFKVP